MTHLENYFRGYQIAIYLVLVDRWTYISAFKQKKNQTTVGVSLMHYRINLKLWVIGHWLLFEIKIIEWKPETWEMRIPQSSSLSKRCNWQLLIIKVSVEISAPPQSSVSLRQIKRINPYATRHHIWRPLQSRKWVHWYLKKDSSREKLEKINQDINLKF